VLELSLADVAVAVAVEDPEKGEFLGIVRVIIGTKVRLRVVNGPNFFADTMGKKMESGGTYMVLSKGANFFGPLSSPGSFLIMKVFPSIMRMHEREGGKAIWRHFAIVSRGRPLERLIKRITFHTWGEI